MSGSVADALALPHPCWASRDSTLTASSWSRFGWGPQPTGLDVRKPAAARISAWSLAADGGGPLPSAPCRGRRRAIKPRALSAVVTE
ncbi:unnamed protein product, partial [Rangifer tarandus platyrhynchus]